MKHAQACKSPAEDADELPESSKSSTSPQRDSHNKSTDDHDNEVDEDDYADRKERADEHRMAVDSDMDTEGDYVGSEAPSEPEKYEPPRGTIRRPLMPSKPIPNAVNLAATHVSKKSALKKKENEDAPVAEQRRSARTGATRSGYKSPTSAPLPRKVPHTASAPVHTSTKARDVRIGSGDSSTSCDVSAKPADAGKCTSMKPAPQMSEADIVCQVRGLLPQVISGPTQHDHARSAAFHRALLSAQDTTSRLSNFWRRLGEAIEGLDLVLLCTVLRELSQAFSHAPWAAIASSVSACLGADRHPSHESLVMFITLLKPLLVDAATHNAIQYRMMPSSVLQGSEILEWPAFRLTTVAPSAQAKLYVEWMAQQPPYEDIAKINLNLMPHSHAALYVRSQLAAGMPCVVIDNQPTGDAASDQARFCPPPSGCSIVGKPQ
jgi:hypothetical protein